MRVKELFIKGGIIESREYDSLDLYQKQGVILQEFDFFIKLTILMA